MHPAVSLVKKLGTCVRASCNVAYFSKFNELKKHNDLILTEVSTINESKPTELSQKSFVTQNKKDLHFSCGRLLWLRLKRSWNNGIRLSTLKKKVQFNRSKKTQNTNHFGERNHLTRKPFHAHLLVLKHHMIAIHTERRKMLPDLESMKTKKFLFFVLKGEK